MTSFQAVYIARLGLIDVMTEEALELGGERMVIYLSSTRHVDGNHLQFLESRLSHLNPGKDG